ncbi:hypothetical protein KFE25_009496 [Diacronema lutheri]|uniref:Uncharacterized protein n=2 Tax=Diacronema lutheri TaxID=2081491 RepID=A0A8J5XZW7_DIALT|nr:hypothetical protein KFE25_009496 [Diacronema lutheri]
MSLDLKALAAEREARMRSSGAPPSSAATPARPRSTTASPAAAKPPPQGKHPAAHRTAPRAAPTAPSALAKAHRSIRMAHSLALVVEVLCALSLFVFGFGTTTLCVMLLAAGFARSGGALAHGALPSTLREGAPPSAAEVEAAAKGAFGPGLLSAPAAALADEYRVLVENLAFACTYGKKNCLTNDMYAGELSLGKVCSLVAAKLSDGTLRCA